MLKKTIKYTDYAGTERTEDFYFNLSKSEITEMELSIEGGLMKKVERIVQSVNGAEIVALFKELILSSYGEKSPDGRYFEKSKEQSTRFSHSPAYDLLFMELATDADKAAAFVNGIIPSDLLEELGEDATPKTPLAALKD